MPAPACSPVRGKSLTLPHKASKFSGIEMALAAEATISMGSKKTLSFKCIIKNAAECFKISERLKNPPFSVTLGSRRGFIWESIWDLHIERDCMSLCQGWNGSGEILTDRNCDRSDDQDRVLVSNCKFMVINSDTQEIVHTECHDSRVIGIRNNQPKEIFKSEILLLQYLYNDTLTVQVEAELSFLQENIVYAANNIITIPPNDYTGMWRYYADGVFTDVTIKCDNKEFKVHKAVFASQSSVFLAMFQADMIERQSGIVEVSGITWKTMMGLIIYLYTGEFPILCDHHDILYAADRYQIQHLVQMCEHELQEGIKKASVMKTLVQADLLGRDDLKKACFEFIRQNTAKLFEANELAVLKDRHESLYLEVLDYCVYKSNSNL